MGKRRKTWKVKRKQIGEKRKVGNDVKYEWLKNMIVKREV